MSVKLLQIQQLDDKMMIYSDLKNVVTPSVGWVRAVRTGLGMTLRQLGKRLVLTKQSVQDIEKREQEGSITLNALRAAANALDMQLVYGFVPKDGSLEALIDRKARELATQIVMRTSHTIKLEDQENTKERIEKAITEKLLALKSEMPGSIWE
jgi:predicted DNA-binding mobile mystery protein A